ncbi:alpha/beta hydrolase [Leisingera sp.]|uniref:alpha/beta hydrolase n=1 Tax=Leisingera sp. TaxID=1879318 RepID=UPI002B275525|nr:alpha/beta hydrolase [Leisingera sp.]
MSPPPNIYLNGAEYPAEEIPEPLRSIDPKLFFATNRQAAGSDEQRGFFGKQRSDSMFFGEATVKFDATDWDALLRRTTGVERRKWTALTIGGVKEVVHFLPIPLPVDRRGNTVQFQAGPLSTYQKQGHAFKQAVSEELSSLQQDSVLLYIHGVNNTFDESLSTLANLWHFSGRQSLPLAFSWPAGNPGVLGYFRDSAAGEVSVFHFKEVMRLLAEVPEVKRIDIVAHSHGSDVAMDGIRELVIQHRAAGLRPRRAMKTGTLILAAADLDVGVVRQRLATERVEEAFEQLNFYINPNDFALGLSAILTRTVRFGKLQREDLEPAEFESLLRDALVYFIRVENGDSSNSHTYFRRNPAVLSDIILALRTGAMPGSASRPLVDLGDGFWLLPSHYPDPQPIDDGSRPSR